MTPPDRFALHAPRAPRTPRRSRWPFWLFVGAMVVALLGGGAIVLLVKRSPDQRNFAADPAAQAAPPQR